MGLGRVELPTSRLSGVRSNHLSYRPSPGALRHQDGESCKLAAPHWRVNGRYSLNADADRDEVVIDDSRFRHLHGGILSVRRSPRFGARTWTNYYSRDRAGTQSQESPSRAPRCKSHSAASSSGLRNLRSTRTRCETLSSRRARQSRGGSRPKRRAPIQKRSCMRFLAR